MSDNEVIINTKLGTSELDKDARVVEKKIQNMAQQSEKIATKAGESAKKVFSEIGKADIGSSASESIKKVANEMSKVKIDTKVGESAKKIANEVSKIKIDTRTPSKEYQKLEDEFDMLANKMDALRHKQDRFLQNGGKTNSSAFKKMATDMEMLEEKQMAVGQRMDLLERQGRKFSSESTSGFKMSASFAKNYASTLQGLYGKQEKSTEGQKKLNKESKKGSSIFSNLTKHLGKHSNVLSGSFKNLLKYTLGIRSLFVLANRLRGALVDGFKNLAQFNDGLNPVNTALSNLKSSLTTTKNSFATAFAPILTTVEPILTALIDKLTQATTAIGMFFAKLTGANTFIKAVKVQENYADSLKNTTAAAKAARKELYAFDQLNVINKNDSGSGGGGGSTGINPNDMFQEVEIPSSFDNIADMIKEAWANADFTEVGLVVGTKIKDALDGINWDEIKNSCNRIAQSIGTFINGFVQSGALQSLGSAIAEGINTAIGTANTFLKTVNWGDLGTAITQSISSFFGTFDWKNAGNTMSSLISGLFDLVSGALAGVDWMALPGNIFNAIKECMEGFDYSSAAQSTGKLTANLLKALVNLAVGIPLAFADIDKQILNYFKQKIADAGWSEDNSLWENGKALLTGILNGIIDALSGVASWIKENIFTPFVDGFKSAFGIDSNGSTETSSLGGSIMQGLKNGIVSKIPTVLSGVTKAKTKITQGFTDLKDSVSRTFTDMWKNIKKTINSILGGIQSMVNGVISGFNAMIKAINKLEFTLPDWVPIVGGKSLGFSIPTIKEVSIPKLATGTVVPRTSSEFAAVLGDNNRETEVVSPLSTMKQAMIEALAEYGLGSNNDVYISADGDLDALIRLLNFKVEKENKRVGRNFEKVVTA